MNIRRDDKLVFFSNTGPRRKQSLPVHDSQYSTQNNFFRVGRSPITKREAATPIFTLRKGVSPNVTIPTANRLSSLDRTQEISSDFKADYEALKKSYQRLLQENNSLRSEKSLILGQSSVSTVALAPDLDFNVQSAALEVEEIYELISESQSSIQKLLDSCSEIHQEYSELKKQVNHLKFTQDLQEYTKSVKINLLQETLNKKIEEIKLMTRDKKRVELAIKETENVKREVESDIRVKENRVKGLESNVEPEVLTIAELYYKLTLANFNLALSERKAAKYEKYIQTNFKDKH